MAFALSAQELHVVVGAIVQLVVLDLALPAILATTYLEYLVLLVLVHAHHAFRTVLHAHRLSVQAATVDIT